MDNCCQIPKGFEKVARDWSEAKIPGTVGKDERILKAEGMRAIVLPLLVALASLQDACFFLGRPRGLRFAPTPGYHLSSPSGKRPQNPLASGDLKFEIFTRARLNGTQMTRILRIFADKTKGNLRKSAVSASSVFH